jgi:hypothetical protein
MKIIQEKSNFNKYFNNLNLGFYLTSPQIRHLINFILTCLQINFNGKMLEMSNLYTNERHRTCVCRFITESPWNFQLVLRSIQRDNINRINEISRHTGNAIELIIDDTISKKAKPRSKALNIIEGAKYHHSHTEKKSVYGHQIVVTILKCGKTVLPFAMNLYEKEVESKISIAQKIITGLQGLIKIDYVLADSWYSSKKVMEASIEGGCTYVGAIKTNRVIYPKSSKDGVQIKVFIKGVSKKSFSLVTVRGKKYYTYAYTGKINGFKNVIIVITYPKKKFGEDKALKAFICSDTSKTTTEILHIYSNRWPIETYIRDCKMKIGLNGYQIHSLKGIKAYYVLVMLLYSYVTSKNKKHSFSRNLKVAKNNVKLNTLEYLYNCVKADMPFSDIVKVFKAS